MPRSSIGQMITFSVELDEDRRRTGYIWIDVRVGDTCRKIAARRGQPDEARRIAKLNKIRSTTAVLRHRPFRKKKGKRIRDRKRVRAPGRLRRTEFFHVLAGEGAPTITSGYAKFETVDRPERTGLTQFTGYDPITISVPIRFDVASGREPSEIERDIDLLERMAGRGDYPGAAVGPPAVVQVSTTNNSGEVVPLIPSNYQWSKSNPAAPLWRVANIEWDENPIRGTGGRRRRQLATVTLQQHTRVSFSVRSAAKRAKDKAKTRKKDPDDKKRNRNRDRRRSNA